MVFVEVRLSSLDLLGHMAEMRIWLDSNRVDTAGFSYREHIDRARARVAFKVTAEAEAFAAHFAPGGSYGTPHHRPSNPSRYRARLGNPNPKTMP